MKTTKGLMDAQNYKSGKPAWKGAIGSRYGSTYHQVVDVRPQISNGGKTMLKADDDIVTSCSKLQKGQIGAQKSDTDIVGGTTIISEAIAETNSLEEARESAASGKSIAKWLEPELKYIGSNGETLSLSQVIAMRSSFADSNKRIRDSIEQLKIAHGFKAGEKMSDSLLGEIKTVMANYQTVTGMDLVITARNWHYININEDYVECSDPLRLENLRSRANYNKSGNRLVARNTPILVIIPIQSKDQINVIKNTLKSKFTTMFCAMKGIEMVASDRLPVNGVDLELAKNSDRMLSANRK